MPYTKEQHREYMRTYRKRDYVKEREKAQPKDREYHKLYMRLYRAGQKMLGEDRLRLKLYQKGHPFYSTLHGIKQRCTNSKRKDYCYYGAKGVRCFLTTADLELMWNRDRAFLLKDPVLHRQGDVGDYTVENCRFIEKSFHSALTKHKKQLTS